MTGRVVTFYSYKGGVGRSFALANIGVILAQWGYRVLMVDWDIEAPGLNHYFTDLVGSNEAGVLDFLDDCRNGKPRSWEHYATPVELDGDSRDLLLMPAEAQRKRDYARLVQELDWDRLYKDHALGARLEELRAQWVERFDFVLVDSRTGVTDFSGLTTAQLPDILAFMFTANQQSLGGCADIARRAMEARRKMPVDRPALLPLPIPGRFEQREEYERAQEWRLRFQEELRPFFDAWAPVGTDTLKLIDLLTIPYVPRWTFGEELAVLLESAGSDGVRSPSHAASYACETIAALLANELANVDLLTSSRDEFVHSARSRRPQPLVAAEAATRDRTPLFAIISGGSVHGSVAELVGEFFQLNRFSAFIVGEESAEQDISVLHELAEATGYIVIFDHDSESSAWQSAAIHRIQRYSLRSSDPKPIIPIVTEQGRRAFSNSRLRDFQAVILSDTLPLEKQLDRVTERLRA